MNDVLLTSSVKTGSLNGYVAAAMQLQIIIESGKDSSPTEKGLDLRPASTPALLALMFV